MSAGRSLMAPARNASSLARFVSTVALVVAGLANAAGSLDLVNHQPVVYANGGSNLRLNLDQGTLGTRTNAQAMALVQSAIALWNGVSTSTLRLSIGTQLPVNYTTSNYTSVLDRYSDGLNPVVFDTDGSLTDLLFGAGSKSSILGFAGSAYYTSGVNAGKYAEGQAVLNGYLSISDATWTTVLAHEFGHFFGLDHSQLDNTQGLASNNYVLMYPIAYRTLASLHEDDVAGVSTLYPSTSFASVYGTLTGTFVSATGVPILGVNVWAKENATGKVYSVVSDYLTQGTGYFKLSLPAGTYTLRAESIQTNFTSGSGVGPYSSSASDLSFQAPNPITPVTLGNASPVQIAMSPGCSVNVTFRVDGSGGLLGTCAPLTPSTTTLASSSNPAFAGSPVTFTASVVGSSPTGTVTFTDTGSTIAGCAAVTLTGAGNTRTAACTASALTLGTHSITASYGGDAANSASSNSALSQVINVAFAPAPTLSGAASRKSHNVAGSFDLPLSLVASNPSVEPRQGPGATIVFTFNKPLASASAFVTAGAATVTGVSVQGNDVIVGLSGVTNAQYVTVAVNNVSSSDGGTGGSGSVRTGFLWGDVNGSRTVSLTDLLLIDAVLTQPVTGSNFLRDVNLSGTFSLGDKLLINAMLTMSLPAP